jgi:hypothetical protein
MIVDDKFARHEKRAYHRTLQFANGYGVSIVWSDFSYGNEKGLFEIAVLRDNKIVYDTPVTQDVIGRCDFGDVVETIARVSALPPVPAKGAAKAKK